MKPFKPIFLCVAFLVAAMASGCTTVKRAAVNQMSDAMVGGGEVFSTETDPELVRDAAPFTLKLMETFLAETPEHEGLLRTLASGFAQYAYTFVHMDADEIEFEDYEKAEILRSRARLLYLRSRDYALRALEVRHPGFSDRFQMDPQWVENRVTAEDVPDLFWAAASWAGAISLGKDDPGLIADLPKVEFLVDLAYQLDPDFDSGAIDTFLITYEMSRASGGGGSAERSRFHLERALELSEGNQAGPYVAYAESVSIPEQNMDEFVDLLEKALAVDTDQRPEWRLVNLINQRRASWLLEHREDFILE